MERSIEAIFSILRWAEFGQENRSLLLNSHVKRPPNAISPKPISKCFNVFPSRELVLTALPACAISIPRPNATPSCRFSTVEIPGGTAFLGTGSPLIPLDGESPLRTKKLMPFLIGTTTVTNAEFSEFVAETDYTTDAERFGWSFVFWSDVDPSIGPSESVQGSEWWRRIDGANWREINGPGSRETAFQSDHPVVHVSWR
ncbi:MAG: formylglycine-generating enzyme family protein, partial [Phycisphaera sp. RhM]|nr:formylglycine-generating enzyme family protein [Phycisphaera sp. RhM]